MSDRIQEQRDFFASGQTLEIAFRLEHLSKLRKAILKRGADIEAALAQDLRRHGFETFLAETLLIRTALKTALKHTRAWSAPRRVRASIFNFPSRDKVMAAPFGTALIISPWNYPALLTLGPLIAALSAGNCAVIKPSELSPHTSALLAEMIRETFPPEYVTVVQGDSSVAQELLKEKFDKIFFTGSTRVGRLVLKAAAEHLTPVTLELGGKSPAIVTRSADLELAARRLVWGKLLNAGQTCLAPDYLLAHRSVKDELVELTVKTIISFYGRDIGSNPDFPRIISPKHHSRLISCLDPAKIVFGGGHRADDLYFGPTLMDNVAWDDPVMAEEIFGPILPVLAFDSLDEAVARINGRDQPLALYLFTRSAAEADQVWSRARFGGGCVNDTLSHIINENLPFGGVGSSGLGAYHGRWGFEAFSHYKSRLNRGRLDIPLRYPPYAGKERLKKILSRLF